LTRYHEFDNDQIDASFQRQTTPNSRNDGHDYDRAVTPPSPPRLIGPHLPLGGGLLKAADRAREIGATAVQVFTDNPTAWRRRHEPPKKLAEFRERLAAAGIGPIAVHAPYLINLCGPDEDFWHKSVTTVANELRVGAQYGAVFVVMHIGSHRGLGREEGISRLVAGMRRALDEADAQHERDRGPNLPMLVLENAAGSGDGIGASIEDLADIVTASAAAGLPMDRIGVCLDTAHLWGAGYDISDGAGVGSLVARIDELLGRERVVMLHLNDSRTTVGSHLDRHEHIGAGQLGPNGMAELLNEPWLATLPTYLETPGMDSGYDKVNLERVRMVLAGERLPKLPPEAFAARGSRTRTAPPEG
jgi:deoxyribonuclease IV